MNGEKIRKIIITTALFFLGMIISRYDIELNGKIAEILQTIDNYSFLIAVFLIIGFLCSITYKSKGRYIKMLSELTLLAGVVVIAVRSLNGSIKLDTGAESLLNDGLLLSTVIGRIFLDKISKEDSENAQAESEIETKFGHKPIDKYVLLFDNRKSQCDLVANIIKNKKIISDGYSICISGEWGSGKTSFIEALLDNLKSDNQKNEEKVPYSVIRINALELENINTLIEYYFKALKNILDEKGAYSGFKSEYKEMVNSFLKIASHDSIADYVTNKLYPQNDYRKSMEELDKLIKDVMKDERIIIVVDDIDRCSDEKATETMFFVKEIATRSNCVSFFLVEYNKLKESKIIKEFGDGFLEKFFNRVVAINKADYNKIIRKFDDVNFTRNIKKVLDYYEKAVESAELELKMNKDSDAASQSSKRLNERNKEFDNMKSLLSNPRKIIKAHEQYKVLNGVVDKNINSNKEVSEETIKKYLEKIDFQKQLILISLLYGFHPDLYTYFECEGYEKIRIESEKYPIDSILYNEWGYW